jgi:hypothetical protein
MKYELSAKLKITIEIDPNPWDEYVRGCFLVSSRPFLGIHVAPAPDVIVKVSN